MNRLLVLLALLLSGCKPVCLTARDNLIVRGAPAAGADTVLAVAMERAPCQPARLTGPIKLPSGIITWRETAWNDGTSLVAGTSNSYACSLDVQVLRLEPAPKSALAHEVAHWFWQWCYSKTGEATVNGRRIPDADLIQWFTGVNTEATRRMMAVP